MQALQIQHFGEPAGALRLAELEPAALTAGAVRVQLEAAGLNPSDLANVRGMFPYTTLPRVPGRDFAGLVVEGPPELLGQRVWGSGGDIGFTRDGSHAQCIDIPAAAAAPRPAALSAVQAAAAGVPFCTAWSALEQCRLQAGDVVLVSGAAGAVGQAAVQLAHARGARVIALVRGPAQRSALDPSLLLASAVHEQGELAAVVASATGGRGVDVLLNGLGGSFMPELLAQLAEGGRMAIYSTLYGGREARLDLLPFYRRRLELHGINTIALDCVAAASILRQLAPLFDAGTLKAPHVARSYALGEWEAAYAALATGHSGKLVFSF